MGVHLMLDFIPSSVQGLDFQLFPGTFPHLISVTPPPVIGMVVDDFILLIVCAMTV